jgi:hypothetical protein
MSNRIAKPTAAKIPPPDRATSVSVDLARSLGLALSMGGATLGQLWLFIVAPLKVRDAFLICDRWRTTDRV